MRKIEVPTNTPAEFELEDTAAKIQRRTKRGSHERGSKWYRNRGRKPGGRKLHTQQSREWPKSARTDRSDSEMKTESGGEAGTSHSNSNHKKGHMTNIYLTD